MLCIIQGRSTEFVREGVMNNKHYGVRWTLSFVLIYVCINFISILKS